MPSRVRAPRLLRVRESFLAPREHDPEEAACVRIGLLRELAANRESLVATHLSFPSVCHVAVDGDAFRWVPGPWEYRTPVRMRLRLDMDDASPSISADRFLLQPVIERPRIVQSLQRKHGVSRVARHEYDVTDS